MTFHGLLEFIQPFLFEQDASLSGHTRLPIAKPHGSPFEDQVAMIAHRLSLPLVQRLASDAEVFGCFFERSSPPVAATIAEAAEMI